MISINFKLFLEWDVVPNKTVLQTDCSDTMRALVVELEKWKAYKVYNKIV